MKNCISCSKELKNVNKSGYCAKCLKPKQCKLCGQIIGHGEHNCANVELKGDRPCQQCGKILDNKIKSWERWSTICRTCSKKEWRKKEKEERKQLKINFGGKCNRCSYDKCFAALHFHHLDGGIEKHLFGKKGGATIKEIRQHPDRFRTLVAFGITPTD